MVRVDPERCASEYPVFMMMLATKLQLRKTADGELGVQQAVSSREEISAAYASALSMFERLQ